MLVTAAVAWGASAAQAQQAPGRITGRVLSAETGEAITAAHVRIEGHRSESLSNGDGRYLLREVEPGVHDVVAEVIGYARTAITGLRVEPGVTVLLDIEMAPSALQLEAIIATAAAERGSDVAVLGARRRAGTVVDAVGAEQISRSPDGNAAAVLARATGVSVVDGRYVYVRGLGDRYGAATLNGSPLASPEPDRKVVPLDLVPSSFLESVATAKTYSPDQRGDHAGGLVEIRTRAFPSQRILKLSAGASYNPRVTLATGLGYDGGAYDFLPFDDGSRRLPALPQDRIISANFSDAELESFGEQFIGAWGPAPRRLPLDQSFRFTLGNTATWFDDVPVGYLLGVTQSARHTNRAGLVERVLGGDDEFDIDFGGLSSTRSTRLGALLNLGIQPAPGNRLTVSAMYSRSADDQSRRLEGYNADYSSDQQSFRIRYVQQELLAAQLKGEHEPGWLKGARFDWRADLNRGGRYEPNTREVLYRQVPDGRYLFETFVQSGSVFHSDLDENGHGGGVDLRVPLERIGRPASLSFGGAADFKHRDAYARRFRFVPNGGVPEEYRERPPDELFSEETIEPGLFEIQEATFEGDNYLAEQSVVAGYGLIDVELLPRLRLLGGARIERATQRVDPLDRFIQTAHALPGARLDDTDVLPALNMTWAISERANVRAGLSRTVARPQFRELAPFKFADYAGGFLTIGNPALERSMIGNYDLRWEWFPALGSVVSVSAFRKRFENPIEAVVLTSTELARTWINAEAARSHGVELEARMDLAAVAERLRGLGVNANVSRVESQVEQGGTVTVFLPFGQGVTELARTERTRSLQGQSPYVVNVGVDWSSPGAGTRLSALYNHFGRRIDSVGDTRLPDVYEEGRGRLDLVLEHAFPNGITARMSAERLLGADVVFTQGGQVVRAYDPGRELSLTVTWDLGG